jgi:hypothetical protein
MDRSVTLTESDLAALIERAVARALAQRPTASTVTLEQAGEMLGCSGRTVRRMRPPHIAAEKPDSPVLGPRDIAVLGGALRRGYSVEQLHRIVEGRGYKLTVDQLRGMLIPPVSDPMTPAITFTGKPPDRTRRARHCEHAAGPIVMADGPAAR